jgi:hypothetical protein
MARRRLPVRAAVLASSALFVALWACESPTEVTLVLTTDVDCSKLNETSITVGTPDDIEAKAPAAATTVCIPGPQGGDSTIGTFVVVPSHGRSDAFAVRVVSGVNTGMELRSATDCAPGGRPPDYRNCIVARRELAFVPHTPLTLPIAMRGDCENIVCATVNETCVKGLCVSANVGNLGACSAPGGCGESVLLGGPMVADASDDSPMSDATSGDATAEDAPVVDAAIDGHPGGDGALDAASDGTPVDGPVIDVAMSDVVSTDGTATDSSLADAAGPDATADAADATSQEGSAGDGSVLGSCVDAGSSTGVTCVGATCPSGQVCCIGLTNGSPTSSSCMPSAQCATGVAGSTTYSALSCRDVGGCAAGTVCCLVPSTGGAGYTTGCQASCPTTFNTLEVCKNSCECPTATCKVPTALGSPCSALSLATCGGSCI